MSHCSIENILLFTLRMYKNVFKYNINAFFFCMHACMHVEMFVRIVFCG